jgi:sulfopyruvate decarboxylase subunit beta
MIGSMGLASSIGFGLAMAKPHKDVVVIDGDGSLLMNMGSLVTIFANNPSNLTWIVIDNGAYGSTGNQDTYCQKIDLVEAAKGVGYKNSFNFEDINLKDIIRSDDVSFIVYKTEPGNSKAPIIDLDPITIKERFMSSI